LNTLRSSRAVAGLLAATLLAACSGGSSAPSTPGGGNTTNPTTVKIKIAGTSPQSKLRQLRAKHVKPKYISVGTNGIAIYAYPSNQGQPQNPTAVADVSASSKYCTVNSDGSGDRVCAVPINAPSGSDDFTVDGYDQPPSGGKPAGNELEVGTALDVTIVQGQPNEVDLTFDGIIASMSIAPTLQVSQDDGVQHVYYMAVNTFDADNYTIIDVTPFVNPLTVAVNNDPNGTLSILPPASGTDPRLYEIQYNGLTVTDAQVTASATGVKTASSDFTSMIVSPQKITVAKGKSAPITASLAVPAGVTENPPFFTATVSANTANCSIDGLSPGSSDTQTPTQPGAPVQFTITGVTGTGCNIAIISPGPIYALLVVSVTIT
jgi:hypothetical protein